MFPWCAQLFLHTPGLIWLQSGCYMYLYLDKFLDPKKISEANLLLIQCTILEYEIIPLTYIPQSEILFVLLSDAGMTEV